MGAGVRFARAFRAFSAAGMGATLLIAAAPAQAHRLKLRPLNPDAIESVRLFHPQARDRARKSPLRASAAMRLEAHAAETRFRTQDGYEIPVAVSSAYTPDPNVEQGYVNLLGGLLHGTELGKISVYIATPSQLENTFCGQGALACYVGDDQRMYVPGVSEHSDPPVQFLIAHEYGHHIELYRSNTPWSATTRAQSGGPRTRTSAPWSAATRCARTTTTTRARRSPSPTATCSSRASTSSTPTC